jgi:WD40 repeat protein
LLATAGSDGTARLWSVATGQELHRLDGLTEFLRHVAFSPDARTLAVTGGFDNDVRLWDLAELSRAQPQP